MFAVGIYTEQEVMRAHRSVECGLKYTGFKRRTDKVADGEECITSVLRD
jgi:hypothetical protein